MVPHQGRGEDDSCWEKPAIGQLLCPSPDWERLKRSSGRTRVAFPRQWRMFLHQSNRCCPVPIRSPRSPKLLPGFPFPSRHRRPFLPPPLAQPQGCNSLFASPLARWPQEIFPSCPRPRTDVHRATGNTPAAHQLPSPTLRDNTPPRGDSPSSSVWKTTSLPSLRPSGLERMSLTWMFL